MDFKVCLLARSAGILDFASLKTRAGDLLIRTMLDPGLIFCPRVSLPVRKSSMALYYRSVRSPSEGSFARVFLTILIGLDLLSLYVLQIDGSLLFKAYFRSTI